MKQDDKTLIFVYGFVIPFIGVTSYLNSVLLVFWLILVFIVAVYLTIIGK